MSHNVVSLELSKQLSDYWNINEHETEWSWVKKEIRGPWELMRREDILGAPICIVAPDLGYMMRKLEGYDVRLLYSNQWRNWSCWADENQGVGSIPEDAAAELILLVFKQGVAI